jgi:hypothetical protein
MGTRGEPAARVFGWRTALRREVSLLMLFKAAALGLLWWLFFSSDHRTAVDAAAAGRRLAVDQTPSAWSATDVGTGQPGEPP